MSAEAIVIRGARTHNLKGIDLDLPRNRLVVITGPSGSGKSSLAFDTIYAEGQRRYVESLSAHVRQALGPMERPDADLIEGLSPAVAVSGRPPGRSPRSTVGTITEVYDFLRLLFARAGAVHCPSCGRLIVRHTVSEMVDEVLGLPEGTRAVVLAPLAKGEEAGPVFERAGAAGYVRVRVDGEVLPLDRRGALEGRRPRRVEVVVDRLTVNAGAARRLADSFEAAARLGDGVVIVSVVDREERVFSARLTCPDCGVGMEEVEPRLFSFNSPSGACPACNGLGVRARPDAEEDGATPEAPCAACGGARLQPEALCVRVGGGHIADLTRMPVREAGDLLKGLRFAGRTEAVARPILGEILDRIGFLAHVGLGYLSLDRSAESLSGGELQRIRLATQVGARLSGVLYVLDEPTVGLHPRDTRRLLGALMGLRDRGNSVLVVEHDREVIGAADHVVDLGPGAGEQGGRVVATGTPEEVAASERSLTGAYLSGRRSIPAPKGRRRAAGWVVVRGARGHNLKGVDARIPLETFVCVTGVSGSGKSSLIDDTLCRALARRLYRAKAPPLPHEGMEGLNRVERLVRVDQAPLGRTPRSNPATVTGLFDLIRDLFAQLPEAKVRGYRPGRFSFNVKGGRCEVCQGDGVVQVEMHFLPDVYVTCEGCGGRRYNRETLEVRYKGRSIADALDMTASEALAFFQALPAARRILETLSDVGLGYLRIGQAAPALSGGEAQRVKLAAELAKGGTGRTLYVLDEPTTGLHFEDVRLLIGVLDRLVERGDTVLVVEHHVDVIARADWVIDLGPEGGEGGGFVVAEGTPEEVARTPASHTGQYLRKALETSEKM
ncbi:MAG: excinuclease ABC subunit A [Candidatus Handelsmanbacteria bacterium RIFCSPLOWO2_12_FULL_64_10]|uniref:UvrABC system protein A n=1 Tax=Handelsmanbacteria sp. (strain RIFCSPLOWO2_12_FULL_64_10) TaxID=1817868 RepID=A0A1F6CMX5_HANXR|nr:MAG: excinuclease ABC subunit A [Candidatus Handelsmanbacteria bacterium RIFCSPLOWO2_12_FULL_64_10]